MQRLVALARDSLTLSDIGKMSEYAQVFMGLPPTPVCWALAALADQIASYMQDNGLRLRCRDMARGNYAHVRSETDEALRDLILRDDVAGLRRYCDLRGHIGFHMAARVAELAYLCGDLDTLEVATARVGDSTGVDLTVVDPIAEYALADSLWHHATTGHLQHDRLQDAMRNAIPVYRQRLALDIARIFDRYHYGGIA